MKKKKLEIMLQSLSGFTRPKAHLEQYTTPANIAADILFLAYNLGDLEGKSVADLGSGPGVFSIGACILGASEVHAVEIDGDAIMDLRENMRRTGCESIRVFNGPVERFSGKVDTVFQNVPFGAQRRHADVPFMEKAMEIGRVIYALHNASTREFVIGRYEEMGGRITHAGEYEFQIPKIYEFHRKERVWRKFLFLRVENQGDKLK